VTRLISFGSRAGKEGEVPRLWVLVLAVAVSLALAFGGSYAVVVSQNGASQVKGPATSYGNTSP
jgi:hypothetical protein